MHGLYFSGLGDIASSSFFMHAFGIVPSTHVVLLATSAVLCCGLLRREIHFTENQCRSSRSEQRKKDIAEERIDSMAKRATKAAPSCVLTLSAIVIAGNFKRGITAEPFVWYWIFIRMNSPFYNIVKDSPTLPTLWR